MSSFLVEYERGDLLAALGEFDDAAARGRSLAAAQAMLRSKDPTGAPQSSGAAAVAAAAAGGGAVIGIGVRSAVSSSRLLEQAAPAASPAAATAAATATAAAVATAVQSSASASTSASASASAADRDAESERKRKLADLTLPLLVAGVSCAPASKGATYAAVVAHAAPRCHWANGKAEEFKVRVGPNYNKNGKKADSAGPALYQLIAVDVFKNTVDAETRAMHTARFMRLAAGEERLVPEFDPKSCPLPRFFICNVQVPLTAPKMFGKNDLEAGVSCVQYFELTRSTFEAAKSLATAPAAVRELCRFFKEAFSNDDIARRFKVVGTINNVAEVGLPSMFQSYMGKPAIIFKTGRLYAGILDNTRAHSYVEMDTNVHDFAFLPRKAIYTMLDKVPQMHISFAYIVQGEEDEELPEQVFACADLSQLDLTRAVPVDMRPPSQGVSKRAMSFES
jgi:hypothetical protein